MSGVCFATMLCPLLINCIISVSALWLYVSSLELHTPATTEPGLAQGLPSVCLCSNSD